MCIAFLLRACRVTAMPTQHSAPLPGPVLFTHPPTHLNPPQDRHVYAHLYSPWSEEGVYRVGDTCSLLAQLDTFEGHHHCLLNLERGLLVLHPDLLLSGTRITASGECTRRSYLQVRVGGWAGWALWGQGSS